MSHHLPLDLLFKPRQDLSLDEAQILAEHIRGCEICLKADGTLRNIDESLRTAEVISPAPGFATRWEKRLEAVRTQTHHRQITITIVGLGTALMLIGGLLIFRIWPVIQSPHLLFMTWVYRLFELYFYLGAISEFTRTVLNFTPNFLPFVVWISSFGMLSSLMLLYLSYRILMVYRGN
jgi:hypothetical protein